MLLKPSYTTATDDTDMVVTTNKTKTCTNSCTREAKKLQNDSLGDEKYIYRLTDAQDENLIF